MTRRQGWLAGLLVLALVAALAVTGWLGRPAGLRVVAHFSKAVGIYPDSDVRVLGVQIGRVVAVEPEGGTVRVEMSYDRKYRIPAGAQAVIVPPSVVSDRYVQLTPAFAGGEALPDGADLPVERTVVPLEIDDIYRALDEFNKALGPRGANRDGALTDLIRTGRANLAGNGADLHTTLADLSQALSTLSAGRQDLFGSVVNLQKFVTALAESDRQVRSFNERLGEVAQQLAGDRDELASALRNLTTALADVTAFIKENRSALSDNVSALADVSTVLARQQRALIDILDLTPLAVSNLNLSYNPRSGTLDTRDDVLGPYDPATFVCAVMADLLPGSKVDRKCFALAQTLKARGLPLPPQLAKLLNVKPTGPSPVRVGAGPPAPSTTAGEPAPAPASALPADNGILGDLTLGGILRGAR